MSLKITLPEATLPKEPEYPHLTRGPMTGNIYLWGSPLEVVVARLGEFPFPDDYVGRSASRRLLDLTALSREEAAALGLDGLLPPLPVAEPVKLVDHERPFWFQGDAGGLYFVGKDGWVRQVDEGPDGGGWDWNNNGILDEEWTGTALPIGTKIEILVDE